MTKAVIEVPSAPVSPELQAVRDELAVLQDIFAAMSGGSIRASEWPRAQRTLAYIDGKIAAAEARAAALSPPEVKPMTELEKIIAARADREPAIPDLAGAH